MLIGISGKMGSGKNEVADMLSYLLFKNKNGIYKQFIEAQDIRNTFLKHKDYKNAEVTLPNITSFAKNLKKCVADCCGINFYDLEDRNVKSSKIPWMDISYRQLLQLFGESVKAGIDKNFWVDSLLNSYKSGKNLIISDVRFPNEVEKIKQLNGLVFRINRNIDTGDHISETALDNYFAFHQIINNDGTLEDLFNKVKYVLSQITFLNKQ